MCRCFGICRKLVWHMSQRFATYAINLCDICQNIHAARFSQKVTEFLATGNAISRNSFPVWCLPLQQTKSNYSRCCVPAAPVYAWGFLLEGQSGDASPTIKCSVLSVISVGEIKKTPETFAPLQKKPYLRSRLVIRLILRATFLEHANRVRGVAQLV